MYGAARDFFIKKTNLFSGSACKARWNNIRDNYRKSLKKNATKSGQASKKIKLYKFSEALGFLKKIFDERDTKGNIEFQKDENEEQEDYEEQITEEENTVHNVDNPTVAKETDDESNQSSVPQRLQEQIQQTPKIYKKRTASQQTAPSASSQLMAYLVKEKSEQRANPSLTPTHPVDAFLSGIGATLKTFNSYDLILAKKEIFDVVQKYELRMITPSTQTSGTLFSEHHGESSGTYRESRQYGDLTSSSDMTQGPLSHVSTESQYTNLTSPGDSTHTQINSFTSPMSVNPGVDEQYQRVHDDDRVSERLSLELSHEKSNTLKSFFGNYQV